MGTDDTTVRGRSAAEFSQACTQDRTVAGVELPGDVATFVRDDDAAVDSAWPPTRACWRCSQEAVALTVYAAEVHADGSPVAGTMWVAEIKRWDADRGGYVPAGALTASTELASFPPAIRGALRAASMNGTHALDALQDYADTLEGW